MLADQLDSPDWRVRRDAVRALASKAPEESVPLLVRALNDADEAVIEAAAEALLAQRHPVGIDAVMRAYFSYDEDVAMPAQAALERHASERGLVDSLKRAATSLDPEVRGGAVSAIGYPFAARELTAVVERACSDPDASVRLAAEKALEYLSRQTT